MRNPLLTFFSYQQEAVGVKGLKDDTTCIVVDLQAQEKSPLAPPKKQGISAFKSMFRRKSSESHLAVEKYYNEPDGVEEIVEEGSAMLSERYVAAILHPVIIKITSFVLVFSVLYWNASDLCSLTPKVLIISCCLQV